MLRLNLGMSFVLCSWSVFPDVVLTMRTNKILILDYAISVRRFVAPIMLFPITYQQSKIFCVIIFLVSDLKSVTMYFKHRVWKLRTVVAPSAIWSVKSSWCNAKYRLTRLPWSLSRVRRTMQMLHRWQSHGAPLAILGGGMLAIQMMLTLGAWLHMDKIRYMYAL